MNRSLGLLVLILLTTACSQTPVKLDQSNSAKWLQHQIDVSKLLSWNINGKIGIRTEKDSGTVSLHWQQANDEYEMRFIAPFGQGSYILSGNANGVLMRSTDTEEVFSAVTPEELMQDSLGWSVHLNGLKYWIRGIPEPNVSHGQILLDQDGRLSSMNQSGFNVSIARYTELDGHALPEKITIKNDNIQLKLVIKSWNI